MLLDKILPRNENGDFNVLIEIPMNSDPVKYEFDKNTNCIVVDRFMQTAMIYPCNYGFIPHTLSDDGDPVDVLVMSQFPIIPQALIAARPIGVLYMEDESGVDEKILAVPASKIDHTYDSIVDIDDVSESIKNKISHFFEYYKKLDKNKWVKIGDWQNKTMATDIILKSMEKFNNS